MEKCFAASEGGRERKILIKSFTRQKGNNENRLMASGVEVREGNLVEKNFVNFTADLSGRGVLECK